MFTNSSLMFVLFLFAFAIGITVLGLMVLFTKVPYQRHNLLSDGEKRFYKPIRPYIEHYFDFYIQVRLASIVKVPDNYFLWKYFSKLGTKTVDFVVCEKDTGKVLLVIELDDKTYRFSKKIKKDKFINKVLTEAKIPIIHIEVRKEYNMPILLGLIKKKLESSAEAAK